MRTPIFTCSSFPQETRNIFFIIELYLNCKEELQAIPVSYFISAIQFVRLFKILLYGASIYFLLTKKISLFLISSVCCSTFLEVDCSYFYMSAALYFPSFLAVLWGLWSLDILNIKCLSWITSVGPLMLTTPELTGDYWLLFSEDYFKCLTLEISINYDHLNPLSVSLCTIVL